MPSKAHFISIINASCLSPYAIKSLNSSASSWERVLKIAVELPSSTGNLPCICLLPPREEFHTQRMDVQLAVELNLEKLASKGITGIYLEARTEAALLKAIRKGIEHFYPQAFRPDPLLNFRPAATPQNGLGSAEKQNEAELLSSDAAQPEFAEEISLSLNLRFPEQKWDAATLEAAENLSSRQIHCYFIQGDTPLISLELSRELYQRHNDYAAELSFVDAYPSGLAPIIFQASILSQLWRMQLNLPLEPSTLFKIIERDMNNFAAEPLIAPEDYRQLRLDLAASNKRQYHILQQLHKELMARKSSEILELISGDAPWLRSLPSYYQVQITEACPQLCTYCPQSALLADKKPRFLQNSKESSIYGDFSKSMSFDLWQQLLAEIEKLSGDAHINLSPLGEPLLHPQFIGFIRELWKYPSLKLVLETSGAYWQQEQIDELLQLNHREPKLSLIISLDALSPELYQELRGSGQDRAHALVEYLLNSNLIRPDHIYIQAVRMKGNETDLEKFYHHWNQFGVQVIMQKYNSFAGLLEERQMASLEPIERMPCRRLARELVVGWDGRLQTCIQDWQGKLRGEQGGHGQSLSPQFPQLSLSEFWQQGMVLYQEHIDKAYPSLCRSCDEYYIYNF